MREDEGREGRVEYLREAIRIAVESARTGGGPFGAVVVRDGRILARAANAVTASNDPTAHAEVLAIREACRKLDSFRLDECEIYASCEPCPMCMGAILWAHPSAVYYAADRVAAAAAGFDDAKIYEELARTPRARRLPTERVILEEADRPFEAWAETEEKTPY